MIYGGLQPDDYIPPPQPLKGAPVSVRFTAANRAWLDTLCEREDRSLNYIINKVLARALADEALRDARAKAAK